jgi:hypothetical protein
VAAGGRAGGQGRLLLPPAHRHEHVRLYVLQLVVALERELERDAQRLWQRASTSAGDAEPPVGRAWLGTRRTPRQYSHSSSPLCRLRGQHPRRQHRQASSSAAAHWGPAPAPPRPALPPTLQLMTDSEPASEQMARYTKMLEVPCSGATW